MGTRSLTIVSDNAVEYCVLYRQHDGYPEGHGRELLEFISNFQIVNGLSGETPPKTANGLDCFAAQLVAHFKKAAGNFYLYPSGWRDCGEEYIYTIYTKGGNDNTLYLKIQAGDVSYFGMSGTPQESMVTIFDGIPDNFLIELETIA